MENLYNKYQLKIVLLFFKLFYWKKNYCRRIEKIKHTGLEKNFFANTADKVLVPKHIFIY